MYFFLGQISFTCSLNLAGGETAEVTVDANLYPSTFKSSYPKVAMFALPSEAEAREGEGREGGVKFVGSPVATTRTVASAQEVIVGDGKSFSKWSRTSLQGVVFFWPTDNI